MTVTIKVKFASPPKISQGAFTKWLAINLEEHFEDEHEWDADTCPPLAEGKCRQVWVEVEDGEA